MSKFLKCIFGLCVTLIGVQAENTKSDFSCVGRSSGYYADVKLGCQVYHMCDGIGRQFTYACPKETLFQQRMLICDHWYMVNCSKAESDYSANLLIGQRGRPFVEDNEMHRTPRPDLVSQPAGNYVHNERTVISGIPKDLNVIGAHKDDERKNSTYVLPSHWSTELSAADKGATFKPFEGVRNKGNTYKTSYNTIHTAQNEKGAYAGVNFQSNFKATTPVYPTYVEDKLKQSNYDDLKPPVGAAEQSFVNFQSNFKATTPVYPEFVDQALKDKHAFLPSSDLRRPQSNPEAVPSHVNFESKFKATTPVYPLFVDQALKDKHANFEPGPLLEPKDNSVVVNFESKFKATTPVYPTSVEATSPNPDLVGLVAPGLKPSKGSGVVRSGVTQSPFVNFESHYPATIPVYPNSVEATSPVPDQVGLVPPSAEDNPREIVSDDLLPPKDTSFSDRRDVGDYTPNPPSKYYQLPKFSNQPTERNIRYANLPSDTNAWNKLRREFFIPDFQFPLETAAVRPGYESPLSSFQARTAAKSHKK